MQIVLNNNYLNPCNQSAAIHNIKRQSMRLSESDKHFIWSLFGAIGIILFWKGIWEGIGALPLLENAWVSLFLGLAILTFSGMIFREFDPLGGIEKGVEKMMHHVHSHEQKHEYKVHYYDTMKKKMVSITGDQIRKIEKNFLSVHEKGREIFIPLHKIKSVSRNNKL